MAESKAEVQVVQANNNFSKELYKVLCQNEDNVFFSPISVHTVLAMAYQGAQESTAKAFAACLKVADAATAAEGYNAVMGKLNSIANVTLLMANKIYLKAGAKLLDNFNSAISKKFLSEVEQLDFAKIEVSAKAINDWVKKKTGDKIQDLIQKNDLNSDTRLVLVNAIYFKCDWHHKFDKERTKMGPFYLNNKDKVDVQMMHNQESYFFSEREDLDAKILKLNYKNMDLSMVIILPNQRDGIKGLEKKLESFDLNNIIESLGPAEVIITVPRFKVETTIDLKEPLVKMGLGEIFDASKAKFRGMIGEDLYVSKAVQKVFIEVSEEGTEAAAATQNEAEVRVARANNHFTNHLYKILCETEKENVFFSPISVHAVLSMTYQGGRGTTAECFAATLKVPNAAIAAEGYNAIMNRLNSVEDVTLLMANKIYVMEGHQLLGDFNKAISKFLSDVQLLNFADSEGSAKIINDWVKEKTREKIQDLISSSALDSATRLVLVNAIYFKGNWKHRFERENTKNKPFYLTCRKKIDVQMMRMTATFSYKSCKNLDAQVLRMHYTNENLSMFIILPNKRDGIQKLEKKLEICGLNDVTKNMWFSKVNVSLPRFKVEATMQLNEPLIKMGLGEIFQRGKANFSGMISGEDLCVSTAVQKAFIEVNEEGSEAAAASGLVAIKYCSRPTIPKTEDFKADHPFIYILSEETVGPLFMGRLMKPE